MTIVKWYEIALECTIPGANFNSSSGADAPARPTPTEKGGHPSIGLNPLVASSRFIARPQLTTPITSTRCCMLS